jgi:23S rRNA pseudouridine2605 synthase
MSEKIHKVLAAAGLGSRREIEKWVAGGRVSVNGVAATTGDRIDPDDKVSVDGRVIALTKHNKRTRVLVYNKPVGEICTRNDPEGRRTVFESLPIVRGGRWVAVGRLDINTSGLLLFTNHGQLANNLMHPSHQVEREYVVRVRGQVDEAMLQRVQTGVLLDDGMARFKKIGVGAISGTHQWFTVVLTEGRQREVRRLWESQGVEVSRLKRIKFGTVKLPSFVGVGQWIELAPVEIAQLGKLVGLKLQQAPLSPAENKDRDRQINRLKARGAGRPRKAGR